MNQISTQGSHTYCKRVTLYPIGYNVSILTTLSLHHRPWEIVMTSNPTCFFQSKAMNGWTERGDSDSSTMDEDSIHGYIIHGTMIWYLTIWTNKGFCDSMIHWPFPFPKKGTKTPPFGRPFVCVDNRLNTRLSYYYYSYSYYQYDT